MKRLKFKLRERSGSVLLGAAGFLLCMAVLASAVMEYRQAYIIADSTEEMVRKATVTMAINNSYGAYTGVRDSRSNAYGASGDGDWADIANTTDLKRQLRKLYNYKVSGSKLTNSTEAGVLYVLDIRNIDYINELSGNETLQFDVTYRLEIPFRFMGEPILTVPIDQTTRASYTPKY
ncbi:hypothetical protein U6B65_14750 (plasmid) [Oscillospiraceae bacterium MB08-C2-2]|nr:hypothetical protein U6B65_14750 [Oscillospiraceae bacterium MB08-C2-2]